MGQCSQSVRCTPCAEQMLDVSPEHVRQHAAVLLPPQCAPGAVSLTAGCDMICLRAQQASARKVSGAPHVLNRCLLFHLSIWCSVQLSLHLSASLLLMGTKAHNELWKHPSA